MILTRKAEDYLEAILNIVREKKYARVRDVSSVLGVKPSSAIEMLRKLDGKGLLVYRKYDGIVLTPKGEKVAQVIKERHDVIRDFLELINVPKSIAEMDACVMEHHLHPETVKQIGKMVNFIKSAPGYPEWLRHFEIFCETGRHVCRGK